MERGEEGKSERGRERESEGSLPSTNFVLNLRLSRFFVGFIIHAF